MVNGHRPRSEGQNPLSADRAGPSCGSAFRKHAVLGLTLLLLVPATGCHRDTPTLERELDALGQSCAGAPELRSYRMACWVASTDEGGVYQRVVEVEFAHPDRWRIRTDSGGEWDESITTPEGTFRRDSDDDRWQQMPSVGCGIGLSMVQVAPDQWKEGVEWMDEKRDRWFTPEKLPDEAIQGVDCLHILTSYNTEREAEERKAKGLAKLDLSDPNSQMDLESLEAEFAWQCSCRREYEMWIGREDCLMHQLRYEEYEPAMLSATGEILREEQGGILLYRYYDINTPIRIETPPLSPQP